MSTLDAIPDPPPNTINREAVAKILDRARLHTAMVQSLMNAPNGPPFNIATFLLDVAEGYLALRNELSQLGSAPADGPY